MIQTTKNNDESSQKVISNFIKRVKKYNLVARKRKTQVRVKDISYLKRKRKAISRINYETKKRLTEKTSKI